MYMSSQNTSITFLLLLAFLFSGCVSIKPTRAEKALMIREGKFDYVNNVFRNGQIDKMPWAYDAMQSIIRENRNVNTPMYLCEASSLTIMMGNKKLAFRTLGETLDLLEGFYDKEKEKKALSLWGAESDKVYKGDPYEQATLYMLFGICLMEQKRFDEATASFKRAMLLDGDSEKNEYRSDFCLPFFLAAKCYHEMNEYELRDNMLKYAADAFLSHYPWHAKSIAEIIAQDIDSSFKNNYTPYSLYTNLLAWKGLDSPDLEVIPHKDWLKDKLPHDKGMDFNTVFIIWNGKGPWMSRAGEYGEIRLINTCPTSQAYVVEHGEKVFYPIFFRLEEQGKPETSMPFWREFGDISYQARTRGKRRVDEELRRKAGIKEGTIVTGDIVASAGVGMALLGSDDSTVRIVGAAAILGGLLIDAVGQAMNPRADTRYWKNLPSEFTILCMKLPPGENKLDLRSYITTSNNVVYKVEAKELTVNVPQDAPVTFYHLFP